MKQFTNRYDTIYEVFSSVFRYLGSLKTGDKIRYDFSPVRTEQEVLAVVSKCSALISKFQNLRYSHPIDNFIAMDSIYHWDTTLNKTSSMIIRILSESVRMQNRLDCMRRYLTKSENCDVDDFEGADVMTINETHDYITRFQSHFKEILDNRRRMFQAQVKSYID